MSSAPTDCRVPDPTDAKADGGFGNHRAGYGPDRLAQAEHWARKGGTLAAGEGLVLVQEIDRLREELAQQSITLGAEYQQAERILWALVNPSPTVLHAMASTFDVSKSLHLALKTASQEVADDR